MLKDRYLWFCFALTLLIAGYFMGDILRAPNDYHFSKGGDGLQTYYQSIYHLKYDTSFFHQQGLNYPYGESIFFTGGQPFTTNVVKALIPVVDHSDYIVGITNLMMLLSIFFCSIFLYLIFRMLQVEALFAVLFAVGLTFLTQQWDRFGGHYPLAYLYAMPGMIYFLMRFYQKLSWKWSTIIAAYILFLIFAHIYYLIFFAVIAFGFWLAFIVFNKNRPISFVKSILHIAVQLVIPFLILQLCIHVSSDVTDRTSIPWGFMVYRSGIGGFLFPYGMWYQKWFEALKPANGVEWEGLAYVGGAAILLFVTVFIYSVFAFKTFYLRIVRWENKVFLGLAIGAILCAAVSFAFPFNYGLDKLLYKLGPIQQFRGIGRFAFVAFYLINVLLIGLFWKLPFTKKMIRPILACLLLALMSTEAYTRVSFMSDVIRNERHEMLRPGLVPEMETFDFTPYQAMIPYPFFHVGSENIGLVCDAKLMNHVFDISVKTGLPTFAASMSRTSIHQAFSNIALAKEMMEEPEVISKLRDNKPLLLICDTLAMTPYQKELLRFADRVATTERYSYYSFPLDGFQKQVKANRDAVNAIDINSFRNANHEIYISTAADSILYDPEVHTIDIIYDWKKFFDHDVPTNWQGRNMLISFWVKDFRRDLIPRTSLEIVQKNGDKVVNYHSSYLDGKFIGMRNGDALIEYHIDFDTSATHLLLSFQNKLLQGHRIECSDLIIRPEGVDCLILHPDFRRYNNRIY